MIQHPLPLPDIAPATILDRLFRAAKSEPGSLQRSRLNSPDYLLYVHVISHDLWTAVRIARRLEPMSQADFAFVLQYWPRYIGLLVVPLAGYDQPTHMHYIVTHFPTSHIP